MAKQVILAMDLGTTGNRVVAFSKNGQVIAKQYYEFTQYYPKPGWVEHDANEIKHTAIEALKDVIAQVGSAEIIGLGLTNQRETTVIWDKETGEPIHHAIVWQCRRTEAICQSLSTYQEIIKEKTGLFLDPYFSGTKIKWLLDNVRGAREKAEKGQLLFGTIDTWILWQLTNKKVHATEPSNASRTMLFNIKTLSFDQELLSLFNIPVSLLPEVRFSNALFGYTDKEIIGAVIPINAILGDQQAALYAHSGWEKGVVKNTYGTGLFVVTNTGHQVIDNEKLVTTVAWQLAKQADYALEGSIFMGGAIIQWLRDNLGLLRDAAQSEEMAQSLSDNEGVYMVPAFQGLGAPYWQSDARALIVGMSRKADQAVLVRAGLESMAYQTKDVIDEMKKAIDFELKELHVDGGACVNNFLMQFQADILQLPVIRPKVIETTALGVAGLSGITSGFWTKEEFKESMMSTERLFEPMMEVLQQQALVNQWHGAVKMALSWSSKE